MKTLYAGDDLLIGAMKRTKVTKQMDETLMDCHERELLEARQHITRGGKRIYALFVTNVGKKYLENI